jgi:preprotein translocase subunit SecE
MAEGVNRVEGEAHMAKVNPGEFIRQVRAEAGKVVWPSRQETVRTAIFVAIMMTILAFFFLGVDQLFGWIMRMLLDLA